VFQLFYVAAMFAIQSSDLLLCSALALIPAIVAAALARFGGWSRRRILLVSATPIPAVAAVICTLLILLAATSSEESCGVDACGMMIEASLSGLVLTAVTLVLGVAFAALGFRFGRR
jgi:hypothetical protein